MFINHTWKECSNCDEKKYIWKEDDWRLDCYKNRLGVLETKLIGVKIKLKQWTEVIKNRSQE